MYYICPITKPIFKPKPTLVICPTCEKNGKTEVLAEIKGSVIEILRFHKGATKIIASECTIVCGACGESVFQRVINERTNYVKG